MFIWFGFRKPQPTIPTKIRIFGSASIGGGSGAHAASTHSLLGAIYANAIPVPASESALVANQLEIACSSIGRPVVELDSNQFKHAQPYRECDYWRITAHPDRTLREVPVQQNSSVRPTARDNQNRTDLVDEVADVSEDAVTQFHAHQTRTE
jgi:hypothetical protein